MKKKRLSRLSSEKFAGRLFILTMCLFLAFGPTHSAFAAQSNQPDRVTLNLRNVSVRDLLEEIQKQTNLNFIFNSAQTDRLGSITVNADDEAVTKVLDRVFQNTDFTYRFRGEMIVIVEKEQQQPTQVGPVTVSGIVCDADGKPLVGVGVLIKKDNRGAATDATGRYAIRLNKGDIITFSYIGKKSVEVIYSSQQTIDIRLEDDIAKVEQVVVTGKFNRRLESETGSSVQFTQTQLREVGNQNVLRSLANLDPSFIIMESVEFGSNPNHMPEIMMRGQSSFPSLEGEYQGNPNQPLFILDGFEVGVEKIFDLDMNRISTITILKDASAKAIYGSKAGNGVVVIETIRPQRGELRVSYSGTLDIEAPDLTGYNLMNAREKLEFEKRIGMYDGTEAVHLSGGQQNLDLQYQAILRDVEAGVDTYWLSKPLRVGTGQKHSVNISGGDQSIAYSLGFNYNNKKGVMKGSDRNNLSSDMGFTYTYKNLIFRNALDFTINNSNNSPYGSFSEYTQLNPYWRTHDDEGNLIPYWTYISTDTYNPLYNASLNTRNISSYSSITDNLYLDWRVLSNLRVTGSFSFTNNNGESDLFYPASHTMFINYTADQSNQKGRYTKTESASTSYNANLGINFSKVLGKHMFFANAAWNMSSISSSSHTYIAEGFGNDDMDDIAFGTKYMEGSTPSGSSNNQREIGIVGALNYSYDDRYLFDGSLRTSGSSMYGADQKWGMFWSLGAGWNIHNEAFARDSKWLQRFKIRGSAGYTGSQNFDPYQAKARYEYSERVYDGGYGAIILGLPNTNLRNCLKIFKIKYWQSVVWARRISYLYGSQAVKGCERDIPPI